MSRTDASADATSPIDAALLELETTGSQQTDGRWLEDLTVRVAPLVREWDVSECWHWADWPDRDQVMPGAPTADVGIDVVARRRSDGAWIAIQAKSRQLDASGRGAPVNAGELDKFLAAAADKAIWAERWMPLPWLPSGQGHTALERRPTSSPHRREPPCSSLC